MGKPSDEDLTEYGKGEELSDRDVLLIEIRELRSEIAELRKEMKEFQKTGAKNG